MDEFRIGEIESCAFVGCHSPAHTFVMVLSCFACSSCAESWAEFMGQLHEKQLPQLRVALHQWEDRIEPEVNAMAGLGARA